MSKSRQIPPLDGKKLAYMAWFRSADKEPKSRRQWALAHDVDRDTLAAWEQSDWFAEVAGKDSAGEAARWTFLKTELEWAASQRTDLSAKVSAIREYGKLMGKYPSEKHEITGRMSLADFFAKGGFTKEGATPARVN